jgi:hypothetical protein
MRAAYWAQVARSARALAAAFPDADAWTRDNLNIADRAAVAHFGWSRYHTVFSPPMALGI